MRSILQNLVAFVVLMMTVSTSLHSQQSVPSDKKATKETIRLFQNLKILAKKGFMFGHQDDLAYGVNWKYEDGRSDVKDVVGDYPAVYGWDIGGIQRADNSKNIDGVPFKKMRQYIREAYERGGVNTISWHADSPFGASAGAWDTTHGTVTSILPGGINHSLYKAWLDEAAKFIASLKGSKGESIPILFRPFHEHTGTWFWWCKNASSDEEYKTLWRFTVYYLQEIKSLHNLLWVYNTSGNFKTSENFLARYPGDDVVDMISFDTYQYGDPARETWFATNTNKELTILAGIAWDRDKLFSLAETGYEAIPYSKWWTETLLSAIGNNPISYVLVWRNHGYSESMKKMHYYAPFRGQVSAEDFIKFYELRNTFFGRDVEAEKLYQ